MNKFFEELVPFSKKKKQGHSESKRHFENSKFIIFCGIFAKIVENPPHFLDAATCALNLLMFSLMASSVGVFGFLIGLKGN